jgi:hypothetical protein
LKTNLAEKFLPNWSFVKSIPDLGERNEDAVIGGALEVAVVAHTAVVLADGRVLGPILLISFGCSFRSEIIFL